MSFGYSIAADVGDEADGFPRKFALLQNHPNPFNSGTTIEYAVGSEQHVTIEVFNIIGQRIRTLVNAIKSGGTYSTEWNGMDHAGRPAPSGLYLYRIRAGAFSQIRKMVILK